MKETAQEYTQRIVAHTEGKKPLAVQAATTILSHLGVNVPAAMLDAAIESARPGGVVAYVTCSPHLAETRDVVTAVAERRGDVTILDAPAVLAEVPGLRASDPRFAQFWPHRHGTDAIFLALLRRE